MVAMPFHGCFDELAVYARVGTEMNIGSPLLKVEEMAEELKSLFFANKLQTDRIAHMRFKDGCSLFELKELPVGCASLFLGFPAKRVADFRFDSEAPMQIDTTKI